MHSQSKYAAPKGGQEQQGQTISTAVPLTSYYSSQDFPLTTSAHHPNAVPIHRIPISPAPVIPHIGNTYMAGPATIAPNITYVSAPPSGPAAIAPNVTYMSAPPTMPPNVTYLVPPSPTQQTLPIAFRAPTPLYYGPQTVERPPVSAVPRRVMRHRCKPQQVYDRQRDLSYLDDQTQLDLDRERELTLQLTRQIIQTDKQRQYRDYNKKLNFERYGVHFDASRTVEGGEADMEGLASTSSNASVQMDSPEQVSHAKSRREKEPKQQSRRTEDVREEEYQYEGDYEGDYGYYDVRPNPNHFRNLALLYQSCE